MIYKKIIRIVIFLLGFLLCAYPLISGTIEKEIQKKTISTYASEASTLDETKIKSALASAKKYNSILYQSTELIIDNSLDFLSDSNYQNQLNLTNNGIMGTIEIPKIDVNLPIYHGTNDDVLSKGIGHVKESSLPVGGKNTRSLLAGHRGLPTSTLFTRLDELIIGDYFFIEACNQKLAYKIKKIEVISPEDTTHLNIIPDKDLISLITCTPYGINTHRLVLTGERVEYNKKIVTTIESKFPSIRESIFIFLPFLFIILLLIMIIKDKKKA